MEHVWSEARPLISQPVMSPGIRLARRVLTLCAASWSLTARRRPSAWLRSDKVQPRIANENGCR